MAEFFFGDQTSSFPLAAKSVYSKLHSSAAEDEMKGMSTRNRLSDRKKKEIEKEKGKEKKERKSPEMGGCSSSVLSLCSLGAHCEFGAAAESAAVPQLLLKTGSGANKFS